MYNKTLCSADLRFLRYFRKYKLSTTEVERLQKKWTAPQHKCKSHTLGQEERSGAVLNSRPPDNSLLGVL